MMAMWHQTDRMRAQRLLDAAQAAAYPQMGEHGESFIKDLVRRCQGAASAVAEAVEQVVWNGRALATGRAIKGAVVKAFGRGAAA